MDNIIKTIIVDDNPAFLKGIASFISRDKRFDIMCTLSSGVELLEHPELCKADLILLDIEMPEMNGIETAKRVTYLCHQVKIVAITMYQDKVYLRELVEAGFRGFVNKVTVPEGLFSTIEAALKDDFIFPENIKL